jgi:hypothetical protein
MPPEPDHSMHEASWQLKDSRKYVYMGRNAHTFLAWQVYTKLIISIHPLNNPILIIPRCLGSAFELIKSNTKLFILHTSQALDALCRRKLGLHPYQRAEPSRDTPFMCAVALEAL